MDECLIPWLPRIEKYGTKWPLGPFQPFFSTRCPGNQNMQNSSIEIQMYQNVTDQDSRHWFPTSRLLCSEKQVNEKFLACFSICARNMGYTLESTEVIGEELYWSLTSGWILPNWIDISNNWVYNECHHQCGHDGYHSNALNRRKRKQLALWCCARGEGWVGGGWWWGGGGLGTRECKRKGTLGKKSSYW